MRGTRPPVDYIDRTAAQYSALGYPTYQWAKLDDPPPWTPVRKPLAESTIGLIATGGIYIAGQVAFHYRDDVSFRVVDMATPTADLRATHFAYDLTDARADPNVVFPIDTLRELAYQGEIGRVSQHAYTCMGGIYSTRKVREKLAPAFADRLLSDKVDLALLIPV
jgi:D-proline reductase (dithiol) PrdB